MSLFDDWPEKDQQIREGVQRTVADMLASGVSVFYGEGDDIIRENPDGRRFVVEMVGREFEIVREIDTK